MTFLRSCCLTVDCPTPKTLLTVVAQSDTENLLCPAWRGAPLLITGSHQLVGTGGAPSYGSVIRSGNSSLSCLVWSCWTSH